MTILIRTLILTVVVSFFSVTINAQNADNETLIIIGNKDVDTSQITISKSDFLRAGKIITNQKGWSVNNYNFSMFALGNSIKCEVSDSMFTSKLREAVLNEKINYRYINIEGVRIIDRQGNIAIPKIDTVKVKFIYK